jgi:hypothetical protein
MYFPILKFITYMLEDERVGLCKFRVSSEQFRSWFIRNLHRGALGIHEFPVGVLGGSVRDGGGCCVYPGICSRVSSPA